MTDEDLWFHDAYCRGAPTDMFFDHLRWSKAIELCEKCRVRQQCLDEAMLEEEDLPMRFIDGVRGGLTPPQRVEIRRKENKR